MNIFFPQISRIIALSFVLVHSSTLGKTPEELQSVATSISDPTWRAIALCDRAGYKITAGLKRIQSENLVSGFSTVIASYVRALDAIEIAETPKAFQEAFTQHTDDAQTFLTFIKTLPSGDIEKGLYYFGKTLQGNTLDESSAELQDKVARQFRSFARSTETMAAVIKATAKNHPASELSLADRARIIELYP